MKYVCSSNMDYIYDLQMVPFRIHSVYPNYILSWWRRSWADGWTAIPLCYKTKWRWFWLEIRTWKQIRYWCFFFPTNNLHCLRLSIPFVSTKKSSYENNDTWHILILILYKNWMQKNKTYQFESKEKEIAQTAIKVRYRLAVKIFPSLFPVYRYNTPLKLYVLNYMTCFVKKKTLI